jgi:hypothetical protein
MNKKKISKIIFVAMCLLFCNLVSVSGQKQAGKVLKYFDCNFNGLVLKSIEPATPLAAINRLGKIFSYQGVFGNFENSPDKFFAEPGAENEHYIDQRYFLQQKFDTLMVDVKIHFPIVGGKGLVFNEGVYKTGMFLMDPTLDNVNYTGGKVWSSKCPISEEPQVYVSAIVFGMRKSDGYFGVTKYWQTIISVPHNDEGTVIIEHIDKIAKTIKGKFSTTISNIYLKYTREELDKIDDWMCKPELYTVEHTAISGEFYVSY